MPLHIGKNLHKEELNYFDRYNKLTSEYSRKALKCGIDLSTAHSPPTELYVTVRVLQDHGEVILPESGIITLERNQTHHLKRSEVEQYIQSGVL